MLSPFLGAVLSTIQLAGSATPGGGDYLVLPFDVPPGTVEFEVRRSVPGGAVVLDFGVWGPSGPRGWGGGLTEPTVVGVDDSSRGYLPGPVSSGPGWSLVVGKAAVPMAAPFSAEIEFRDAPTLAPRPRGAVQPVVLAEGARWYAGDLHVHDSESGDANASLDDVAALASARGLDFIALSDHNTVSQQTLQGAKQAALSKLLLLRSIEVTTYAGHGGALGASAPVDHRVGLEGRTAASILAEVRRQGGLFIVNHPALDLGAACIGCAWSHPDTPWQDVAAVELQTGNYEVARLALLGPTLAFWEARLDEGARLAAVGGSDDHRAGRDTGATASRIGTPTTRIFAPELSEAAVLEAIRQGRTQVALRGPDDPLIELETATGQRIGDEVPGGRVTLEARVTGGEGLSLELVRDGAVVARRPVAGATSTHRFELEVGSSPGRVRAQLVDGSDPIVVTSHLWLLGGPTGGCVVQSAKGAEGASPRSWLGALLVAALASARSAWRGRRRLLQ
jgi:hypothetical protein